MKVWEEIGRERESVCLCVLCGNVGAGVGLIGPHKNQRYMQHHRGATTLPSTLNPPPPTSCCYTIPHRSCHPCAPAAVALSYVLHPPLAWTIRTVPASKVPQHTYYMYMCTIYVYPTASIANVDSRWKPSNLLRAYCISLSLTLIWFVHYTYRYLPFRNRYRVDKSTVRSAIILHPYRQSRLDTCSSFLLSRFFFFFFYRVFLCSCSCNGEKFFCICMCRLLSFKYVLFICAYCHVQLFHLYWDYVGGSWKNEVNEEEKLGHVGCGLRGLLEIKEVVLMKCGVQKFVQVPGNTLAANVADLIHFFE